MAIGETRDVGVRASGNRASKVDAVIVGAGLAGLYTHHKLRSLGLTLRGFEAGPEVGGTWYWNRYPGARCDVESLDYSFSFSEELLAEWKWSERFPAQPELLRYVNYVADRFDLRRDVQFDTRVVGARYDEASNRWMVETDDGEVVECRFLIAATGCLSLPKVPDFAGLEDFEGKWVQTSAWPREGVDYAGKRVAVIGTGSSGIQAIPLIADDAEHLTVFQRTPNFSVPARNGPIDHVHEAKVRADYSAWCRYIRTTKGGQRQDLSTGRLAAEFTAEQQDEMLERAWQFGIFSIQGVFNDITRDPEVNAKVAAFVHNKIRRIVKDERIADLLCPKSFPFGTKRLCLDTGYYATFNRPNVDLVDLRATPLERITAKGVRTSDKEYPVDLIVFATGFDAMTGSLLALNIQGIGGRTLNEAWDHGPSSYLGLMVEGFPNLFTVNGPMSPSVLVNMIASIEHHVDWIADCIAHMESNGLARIEADPQAQDGWAHEVAAVAERTLFPQANSWYMGANVPGKPRLFMCYIAGFDAYQKRVDEIVAESYRGFIFDKSAGEPESAQISKAVNA